MSIIHKNLKKYGFDKPFYKWTYGSLLNFLGFINYNYPIDDKLHYYIDAIFELKIKTKKQLLLIIEIIYRKHEAFFDDNMENYYEYCSGN